MDDDKVVDAIKELTAEIRQLRSTLEGGLGRVGSEVAVAARAVASALARPRP